MSFNPHESSPLATRGPAPERAAATLIMIHGRGASAEGILELWDELEVKELAAVAPQARGGTWYPQSFLAPLDANQPYLDSALARIESIVDNLLSRGIPGERIALLGFSQGACLASEFFARHPRRYGAAMILTGGLIGPDGTPRNYAGSLDRTPIFLGAGDPDPHVPFTRVEETRDVFGAMKATVQLSRYPGLPHGINADEIETCQTMLRAMIGAE